MLQREGTITVKVCPTHVAAVMAVTRVQMEHHGEPWRGSPIREKRYRERWVANLVEVAWGIHWDKAVDWTLGRAPHFDFRHGRILLDVKSVEGDGNLLVGLKALNAPDHANAYALGVYDEAYSVVRFVGWATHEELDKLPSHESTRNAGDYKLMSREDLADNWEVFKDGSR